MGRTLRNFPDPVLVVGGKATISGSTTISVAPIACKDSNKVWPMITQEDISVDLSSNGLNGLDEGTIQVSTTYYLYIIKSRQFINDLPAGFVFSLSDTAPSFPHASDVEKYDLYRKVGTFGTDSTGQIEETGLTFLIKAVVSVYADLPVTPDDVLDVYLVRTGTGIWLINRKPAGLYNWNGSAWVHMSSFPDQFNTTNLEFYDNADNSKRLGWIISAIATATKRFITMPGSDITLFNEVANIDTMPMNSIPVATQGGTFSRGGGCVFNVDNYNKTNWTSVLFVVQTASVGLNGATIELFDKENNTQIGTLSFVDIEDDTTKILNVTSYFQSLSGRFFLEANIKADGGGAATIFDFISLEIK